MKKIITFLFTVSMMSSAFAQYGSKDQKDNGWGKKDNDVVFNDGKFKKSDNLYNDSYFFSTRDRDMQIAQINREYDFKIQSVKSKFFMSRSRKEQMICVLEDQRKNEIKMVYAKFSDRKNKYDDHDRYDDHKKRNW